MLKRTYLTNDFLGIPEFFTIFAPVNNNNNLNSKNYEEIYYGDCLPYDNGSVND